MSGGPGPTNGSAGHGRHRPFHYVDLHRRIAVLLVLAAAVLGALSINGPWWTATRVSASELTNEQVQNVEVEFNAGGSASCSSWRDWHPDPCANISSSVAGVVGSAYGALDLGLGAIVAGALGAGALLGLGLLGYSFGRAQFTLAIVLALAVGLLALGMVGFTVALGPGPQAAGYCAALSANQTTCPSFLGGVTAGVIPGSCIECASKLNWGGGYAFFATIGLTAASLFGAFLLWRGRHGPFTQREQWEWAAANQPYQLTDRGPPGEAGAPTGATLPSTGRNAIPFSASRTTRWVCHRCRTVNSPWATRCGACGDHRASDR